MYCSIHLPRQHILARMEWYNKTESLPLPNKNVVLPFECYNWPSPWVQSTLQHPPRLYRTLVCSSIPPWPTQLTDIPFLDYYVQWRQATPVAITHGSWIQCSLKIPFNSMDGNTISVLTYYCCRCVWCIFLFNTVFHEGLHSGCVNPWRQMSPL